MRQENSPCPAWIDRLQDATTEVAGSDRLESRRRARGGQGALVSRVGKNSCRWREVSRRIPSAFSPRSANAITFVLAAATNYRGADHRGAVERALSAAAETPYDRLKADHVADHQRLFRRVHLTLTIGRPTDPLGAMPTDDRLERVKAGETDLGLEALVLSIRALSADCQQPAGRTARKPAGAVERQHVPAMGQRLSPQYQCADELLAGRSDQSVGAASAAVRLLEVAARPGGGRRACITARGDSSLITSPTSGASPRRAIARASGLWPMGAAWLSQHLWEHYQFTQDRKFLAEAPIRS